MTFCVTVQCGILAVCQHLKGKYCLYHQGWSKKCCKKYSLYRHRRSVIYIHITRKTPGRMFLSNNGIQPKYYMAHKPKSPNLHQRLTFPLSDFQLLHKCYYYISFIPTLFNVSMETKTKNADYWSITVNYRIRQSGRKQIISVELKDSNCRMNPSATQQQHLHNHCCIYVKLFPNVHNLSYLMSATIFSKMPRIRTRNSWRSFPSELTSCKLFISAIVNSVLLYWKTPV